MHNVWLIAKREYLERVRTKGFLIATVLIPLLMGALVFGSAYMGSKSKTSSHIAVVTSDSVLGSDLKHQLEGSKENDMQVDVSTPSDDTRAALDVQLHAKSSSLAGYLWVTPAAGDRPTFTYTARSAGDIATQEAIESALHSVLMREHLEAKGMAGSEIDALVAPVKIDTSASGNSTAAFFAAYTLFFLMYMVIMLYGMNTARSIIEEKTSRVFEVLLATIKPEELLAGKILGVGAVGLTQIGLWMIAAFALSSSSLASGLVGTGHGLISTAQIGFFVMYFLFGFLLYSSVAAALGAMTNSEQELQQLNMFLVLPLAFCMVMLFSIIRAPNSTMARVVSLIPFCSPLLMNFRISLTQVPAWEIWLSIVLMSATIFAILWVSSRIYRVGILMYGKKPNLPEILRWLKYS
ncbi:ABC transporter permease [Granulicella sp. S156]|uniref:ABC transporter permease n=1 Tax=Granulicella sp. S156 TaxID=1747224 RepID=UPI00131B79FC|nr:ABC transporter permease [Granulicella sp. S156]